MAVIPRYVSEGSIPPAVSNVRMNASVAAAPYNDYANQINKFLDIFHREMLAWEHVVRQKEKEEKAAREKDLKVQEDMYKAEAMADLSVKSNAMYQLERQRADGSMNFAQNVDANFQKLADAAILGAPTQRAQIDLTKRLIGMRSGLYNRAVNEGISINNQANMNKLENMLTNLEGLAASDPLAAAELKGKSSDVFNAMEKLGIPERHRQQIYDKFSKRIDYNALKGAIDKDPLEVENRLNSGQFAYLGEGNINSIKNLTKSSINAYKKQANEAIEDVENKIMSGQPIPQDLQNRIDLANKYGLTDRVDELEELMELNKVVSNGDYGELQGLSNWLKQSAALGALKSDPKRVKKLADYVDGNIKAMEDDGLTYAELKGRIPMGTTITDFENLSPDIIKQRKFKGEQVAEFYGKSPSLLKKEELETLSNQIENMTTEQKIELAKNLSILGAKTVDKSVKKIEKKDPGLAQAIEMYQISPELSEKIMKGKAALKARVVKSVEYQNEGDAIGVVNRTFGDDPELQRRLLDAGRSLMAYDSVTGSSEFANISKAVKSAGNIIDVSGDFFGPRKGYSTVAPGPDMNTKSFDKFVNSNLKDIESWTKYGNGQPISAGENPIVFSNLEPRDLKYKYDKSGNYYVYDTNDNVVLNEKRQPIYIDLKKLYADTNR